MNNYYYLVVDDFQNIHDLRDFNFFSGFFSSKLGTGGGATVFA